MQEYKSVNEILMIKNEFIDALKSNDKDTAKNKLKEMKTLYKKITGKDMVEMFSEDEWEIIGDALGENYMTLLNTVEKRRYAESEREDDYEK